MAVIAVVGSLVSAGGAAKLLDWLKERRSGVVAEYSTFLGELRGEIHQLKDQLHTKSLQQEVTIRENATLKSQIDDLKRQVGILSSEGDVAIVVVRHDGNVTAWSPAATEMFGYQAGEAIGKNLTDLIVPAEYSTLQHEAMAKCFAENRPPRGQPLIIRAKNKWGHNLMIDVSLTGTQADGDWFYTGTIHRRVERFD